MWIKIVEKFNVKVDMYRILSTLILILLLRTSNISTETTEVMFLISSQDNPYHGPLATRLHDDIINQAESQLSNSNYIITVHVLHKIFNFKRYWAIKNVLPLVRSKLLGEHTKWVVWLEESTHVSLLELIRQIEHEDATQLLYLGHTLYDNHANIRHHFAFNEDPTWFPFPFQRAGIVFSRALIIKTADVMDTKNADFPFIIDMEHELAIYIYNKVKLDHVQNNTSAMENKDPNGNGHVLMRKVHYICPQPNEEIPLTSDKICAMYAKPMDKSSCITLQPQRIFFAVKTCEKFHNDRLQIVKATWGRIATHIRYYSDVKDSTIPTISTGVPNIEKGHCQKTLQIFKLALQEIDEYNMQLENLVQGHNKQIQWLVLADDDTLLSIPHLCDLLGCFNYTNDIYLGERFGYHFSRNDGYNYITSGGGVAMSLSVVRKLIANCRCMGPYDPDDMLIGDCLDSLGVSTIHSPQFHQFAHIDYPDELLALDRPISFHKFFSINPYDVYDLYFSYADQKMKQKL